MEVLEVWELIHSLEYIEKVRIKGVNKGRRPRLSNESNSNLYYAGHNIIVLVRKYGNKKQVEHVSALIASMEKHFN